MHHSKEVEAMLASYDPDTTRFKLPHPTNQKDGVGNSANCDRLLDLNERRVH